MHFEIGNPPSRRHPVRPPTRFFDVGLAWLWLDQFVANRVVDDVGDRMKPEFASDRASVRLHSLVADSERRGDRLISFTLGQQLDDRAFAPREWAECRAFTRRSLCKKRDRKSVV